jgi:hypothetical protein
MNDLTLIKEVIIPNPPTFYQIKKVKKSKEAGVDIYDKHYLTGNLFYIQNVNYHVISKITHDVKLFLLEKVGHLPELEKMALEFEYHRTSHIDLDNKIYFFKKLLLDILKTPTQRQILNATKRKKEIITTNTIPDDSTKYIDYCSERFVYGEHKLIIRIYGRVKSEQKELDLFFI